MVDFNKKLKEYEKVKADGEKKELASGRVSTVPSSNSSIRYTTGDDLDFLSSIRRAGSGGRRPSRKSLRADELPLVSVLSADDMANAIALMQADREYAEQQRQIKGTREMIRQTLGEIAMRNSLPGMRYGSLATYCNGMVTRKHLSREALVTNNVTTAQIDASYVDSEPFLDVRVRDVSVSEVEDEDEW